VSEEGKRLFVGLRVSLATANALGRAVETLGRRARDGGLEVRWVPPAGYHVTLKFLGWTRATAIEAVADALPALGEPEDTRLALRRVLRVLLQRVRDYRPGAAAAITPIAPSPVD